MQEPNTNLLQDFKSQIITSDTEIKENEKLLAEIEPGFWMRALTGYFFVVIEILLYLVIIILVLCDIKLNASWFNITMALTSSTTVDVAVHNNGLDTVLYILNALLGFAVVINLLLALLLRKSRKNLFKLARVAEYLEKTLKDRKVHRDRIFDTMILLEKQAKP